MIEIDDKIVSADLLREYFACDLAACKGICCVEGNAGAPLEMDEVDTLEEEYPNYKPYMTPEGIRAVESQGFMVSVSRRDHLLHWSAGWRIHKERRYHRHKP